jgi:antitoxin (DNA-binding transcriptional repressor) of toxin-antitoxin stability system
MKKSEDIMKTSEIRAKLVDVFNTVFYKEDPIYVIKGKRPVAKIVPLTKEEKKEIAAKLKTSK